MEDLVLKHLAQGLLNKESQIVKPKAGDGTYAAFCKIFDKEMRIIEQSFLFGQISSPREFSNVATFVASPAVSYVNGVLLSVDGGINISLL